MGNAKLQKSSEKLAKKLLLEFGGTATYNINVPESTDQTTGNTIPATSTPYTINTYQRGGTLKELESNQVTNSQKVFLIEAKALPAKPSSDDTIEINSETLLFSKILKSISGGQEDVMWYVVFGV